MNLSARKKLHSETMSVRVAADGVRDWNRISTNLPNIGDNPFCHWFSEPFVRERSSRRLRCSRANTLLYRTGLKMIIFRTAEAEAGI